MNKTNKIIFILLGVLFGVWMIGWSVVGYQVLRRDVFRATNPEDYTIRFGYVETDPSGNYTLTKATTTIPMKLKASGFLYGLDITAHDGGSFSYECVFHFSSAPKVVTGQGFNSTIPSDTMRTPKTKVEGNALEYYWFDAGDPMGEQSVDILINGVPIKTIKYNVVADK